jgi:hypothetical protein
MSNGWHKFADNIAMQFSEGIFEQQLLSAEWRVDASG